MKKIICYVDDCGNVYSQKVGGTLIGAALGTNLQSAEGGDHETLIKLVTSGVSAEDIIKLKHGGVL